MFKVGDKVRLKSKFGGNALPELFEHIGVIVVKFPDDYENVGVDFGFSFERGHNLDGSIKSLSGRWFNKNELTLDGMKFNDDEWE